MRRICLAFCLVTIWSTNPVMGAASRLESALLAAVQQAHFGEVIDFGAGNEERPVRAHLNEPARQIAHLPNVDVAVIDFDPQGRMVDRAEVLLSRDYPAGVIVPLDPDRGAARDLPAQARE